MSHRTLSFSSGAVFHREFLGLLVGLAVVAAPSASARAQAFRPLRLTQAPPRKIGKELPDKVSLGPVIPGLAQGAVPQGLGYVTSRDWLIISYYFDGGRPSMLSVVDVASGEALKSITLKEDGGGFHTGHVGGVAVSPNYLWVASGGVYRVPLQRILNAREVDVVEMEPWFMAESLASYAAFADGVLWIGEFVRKGQGGRGPAHRVVDRDGKDRFAWVSGYKLDEQGELIAPRTRGTARLTPDYVLTVPDEVQGIAFVKDHVLLSASYGRANPSKLMVFRDPHLEEPHRMVTASSGREVPCWFLDSKLEVRTAKIVPMAEGIVPRGDGLALITESGAAKYQKGGKGALDYVVLITPK